MRPVLLQWRNIKVWSYPAMLYVGLVLGVAAGNIAAHAAGLDALRVYVATLFLIVPALAGARLLYVAAEWRLYSDDVRRIWDRKDGGYIMYGGLPCALLVSMPVLRILGLNFAAFWDVAIFTILVGMFFTRIGCLLNGCCAGRPSRTWMGLYLPNSKGVWEKRIPTQALEAALAGFLLLCAVAARRSVPFPGALFLLIALGYASGRLLMEFARERKQEAAGFSMAHVISLVITLLSISTLTFYWRK
jgi:phosphatidylglycerol---prolipoprotein diacylglyceryl transferase